MEVSLPRGKGTCDRNQFFVNKVTHNLDGYDGVTFWYLGYKSECEEAGTGICFFSHGQATLYHPDLGRHLRRSSLWQGEGTLTTMLRRLAHLLYIRQGGRILLKQKAKYQSQFKRKKLLCQFMFGNSVFSSVGHRRSSSLAQRRHLFDLEESGGNMFPSTGALSGMALDCDDTVGTRQ